MRPTQFADQIAKTAQRYEEREVERAAIRRDLGDGGPLAADTPKRVALRLERLGFEPAVADAVLANRTSAAVEAIIVGEHAGDVVVAEMPAPPVVVADRRARVVLERLLGENDLIEAAFLEAGYRAARSVGRIDVRRDGRHIGFGTGSLVSPRLLLTNNHVLETAADAAESRVEFDYQVDPSGVPLVSTSFALDPNHFFVTDAELDYTIVAVVEQTGQRQLAEFSWNPMIGTEGKVLRGEKVNIIQHPGGEPKQLALRENRIVDLLELFVHYETDTAPGSSGSPVFNDEWELVALHHSGVPKTDAQGRILALSGQVWNDAMGEGQIAWIANEGVRISRILRDLERRPFAGPELELRAQLLEAAPPPSVGSRPVDDAVHGETGRSGAPPEGGAAGATWTVPLHIVVEIGAPTSGRSPQSPVRVVQPPTVDVSDQDPELAATLRDLERSRRRPYYEKRGDEEARGRYYAGVDANGSGAGEFYRRLSRLVTETHARQPAYKPSRLVYPWVDLHRDRQLRSIYSGKTFDPAEFIREDFAMERRRAERLREIALRESSGGTDALLAEEAALEAAFPYNCEHVVPQSWFEKREPMRGDLHHLFACEWGCNSFRGNIPYYEFQEFEEAIRDDCGKREENRFEPAHGKGTVARAVLYFLLRYPKVVASVPNEFQAERVATLLAWHDAHDVGEYELHRNQAIYEMQGNRNPLIDHPDWAERIDFELGLGV